MFTVAISGTYDFRLLVDPHLDIEDHQDENRVIIVQRTNEDPIILLGTTEDEVHSFQEALDLVATKYPMREVRVCGAASSLLETACNHQGCSRVIITCILRDDVVCKYHIPIIVSQSFELKSVHHVQHDKEVLVYERRLNDFTE